MAFYYGRARKLAHLSLIQNTFIWDKSNKGKY